MRNAIRLLAVAVALTVSAALAPAQERSRNSGMIRGTVVDRATDQGLAGVSVVLTPRSGDSTASATVITREDGAFIVQVAPGAYQIELTLLGYQSLLGTVVAQLDSIVDVYAEMSSEILTTDPLVVTAQRRGLADMGGFDERRRQGRGTFITREDIENRRPFYVSDLLRAAPGVRLVPVRGGSGYDVRMRNGCVPDLWIDGVRTSGSAGLDTFLNASDLEALEVYHSGEVPPRFGNAPCGAVIAWTRVPTVEPGRRGFWTRFVIAAGFVSLAYFLTR